MARQMKDLRPAEWVELWRSTRGTLPSGVRWWLRVASRGDVAARRAFHVEGRGWFRGPATERGHDAELVRLVNDFHRKVSRRVSRPAVA